MVLDGHSVGNMCPAGACVCSKCGRRAMSVICLNIVPKGPVKLCRECNKKRANKENKILDDCKKDKIEWKKEIHSVKWKDL